jgi:hypothetical protein
MQIFVADNGQKVPDTGRIRVLLAVFRGKKMRAA